MERRWSLLACAVPLALAACSSEPAVTVAAPTGGSSERTAVVEASQAPRPTAPAAPPTAPSPPSTPQQQALAAYARYVAGSVEALAAGAVEDPSAIGAGGQALRHLRARVRANAADGVVAAGDLTPSAAEGDVQLAAGIATVTDCVLNGLEHVDADDPDRVVAEATGWRQPVVATVVQRDGAWTVTRVTVPLRDGSGRVPPPPDDPPYLRGPAQGPAPPSCVPPELADAAVRAYRAFREAYDDALGIGRSGPANPDSPALRKTAVDPQLSAARIFVRALAADGGAFRGEPDQLDPWAVASSNFDRLVVLYDCVKVGGRELAGASERASNARHERQSVLRLDGVDVVRRNRAWKVRGISVIDEGLSECTSSASVR